MSYFLSGDRKRVENLFYREKEEEIMKREGREIMGKLEKSCPYLFFQKNLFIYFWGWGRWQLINKNGAK